MELRKQKEIEYYDKRAKKWLEKDSQERKGDFEGFNPFLLGSYNFLADFLKDKCKAKRILDYGCGNGIHSVWLAENGAEVFAIDLSKYSLQIAEEKIEKAGLKDRVKFLLMDCENLNFPDNFFDIIFDSGTFYSLDLDKSFAGLAKVLRPNGFLIGIETLGHNPLTNFKRKINKIIGKRTELAEKNIFKMNDLERAKKYFNKIDYYFFHVISWLAFPFLALPGAKTMLRLMEKIDKFLLRFRFLRKYAFKIVFIFSCPKKQDDEKII